EAAVTRATRKVAEAPRLSSEDRHIVDSVGASGELLRLLEIRVPDLHQYQNLAYAKQYAEFVARVWREEQRKTPGQTAGSVAVAGQPHQPHGLKDGNGVAAPPP